MLPKGLKSPFRISFTLYELQIVGTKGGCLLILYGVLLFYELTVDIIELCLLPVYGVFLSYGHNLTVGQRVPISLDCPVFW